MVEAPGGAVVEPELELVTDRARALDRPADVERHSLEARDEPVGARRTDGAAGDPVLRRPWKLPEQVGQSHEAAVPERSTSWWA